MRIGLQLPRFDYPGVAPADLLDRLTGIAATAEASGFDSLFVMDHLHQIPGVGAQPSGCSRATRLSPRSPARTERLNLGLMVGGVTYRNPALHAKITTTLDVLSGGRAIHALGAAWFEDEHRAYGFDFPPLKERFERLEDALRSRARCSRGGADRRGHALPGGRRATTTRARSAATSRSSWAAAASGRRSASSPSTPTPATSSATPSRSGT